MKCRKFDGLLTVNGWLSPAWIQTDQKGNLSYLSDKPPGEIMAFEHVSGYALPGFLNAHSHAFQYAMAGLAEIHEKGAQADDFWSWRNTMYNIALSIDPDQMEAIASMLYAEMVFHGYTSVAEFHYVHHDKNGNPYENKAEMGERLMRAAQKAGIRLTLLPIFYQKGGFGKDPLEHQKRFISSSVEEYSLLLDSTKKAASNYENVNLGWGIHSLRAVSAEDIITAFSTFDADVPVHMHISEQIREVEECQSFLKARPVEWLSDNVELHSNLNLVHATHQSESEVRKLAKSDCRIILCPSTEGNLGDGIFPLVDFQSRGGDWTIGTDSHIGLNPFEELRLLDYGQRLISHKRNTFSSPKSGDSGLNSLKQAILNGKKSMGWAGEDFFQTGTSFDALVLDASAPLYSVSSLEKLVSTAIYTGNTSAILGTLVGGQWITRSKHHKNEPQIRNDFEKSMRKLNFR